MDPNLVVEVLEASANRESGIFKDIKGLHPKRNLDVIPLCHDCVEDECFFAWVEELCQLWEVVRALERVMGIEKRRHDLGWDHITITPEKLATMQFHEMPWPMRNPREATSPKMLQESEVRRFLFSRCIIEKHLAKRRRRPVHPKEVLAAYKRMWNPRLFKRRLRWYNRLLPSFMTEQAAILKGVALVWQYLDEYEDENRDIFSSTNSRYAQWLWKRRAQSSEFDERLFPEYPRKSPRRNRNPVSSSHWVTLGVTLCAEAVLYTGLMRAVRAS